MYLSSLPKNSIYNFCYWFNVVVGTEQRNLEKFTYNKSTFLRLPTIELHCITQMVNNFLFESKKKFIKNKQLKQIRCYKQLKKDDNSPHSS